MAKNTQNSNKKAEKTAGESVSQEDETALNAAHEAVGEQQSEPTSHEGEIGQGTDEQRAGNGETENSNSENQDKPPPRRYMTGALLR